MSFDNVKGKGKGSVPSNAGSSSLYEEDVKDYDDKHGGSEGSSPEASPVSEAHHHDWVNASGKNVVVGHYIQKYKHENTIALYAIGLRGFVMFPYCMAHYGGGAFLLVFSFMLVVLGITGALLEMSWGQALNQAMPRVFDDIHPRWAGATASAAVALMLLLCSSTLLVGYSGVYFFACFRMQDVPWQGKAGEFWVEGMHGSFTLPLILSLVGVCATQGFAQLSPSFTRNVTLLLPFPLVVLAMTFIRGLSLDGAKEGLGWLFAFSFADVGSSTTWAAAAGQALLVVGSPGSGSLIDFARSVEPGKKVYTICVGTAVLGFGFSLFSALTVGAGMGVFAHSVDIPLDTLKDTLGVGLSFVSMSHIGSTVGNGKNAFLAMLFSSLWVLGLAGANLWFTALSGVIDMYFKHLSTSYNRVLRTALIAVMTCVACIILSIVSKSWYVRFADYRVGSVLLLGMLLVEFVALHYDYSLCRLERQTTRYWGACWFHLAPLVAFIVLVRSLFEDAAHGWIYLSEWLAAAVPLLAVPAGILWFILQKRHSSITEHIEDNEHPLPRRSSAIPIHLLCNQEGVL